MFGRNGEAPVPVVAPRRPPTASTTAIEAVRIAIKYRTPVILLSDGYLANGAEPWRIPDVDDLPDHRAEFATEPNARTRTATESSGRTCATRRRWPGPWAVPGTPGLEHRIGGIEKADGTGNISYDPANHDLMVRTRAGQDRRDRRATSRRSRSTTRTGGADVLVLGWGSTYGPIGAAVRRVRAAGRARRAGPPAAPEPVPGQPRRGPAALRPGDRAGDEPRPAGACCCAPSTWSTSIGYNQVAACRSRPSELAGVIEEEIDR